MSNLLGLVTLPNIIFVSSILSVFNSVQCMIQPLGLTRKLYSRRSHEVTPLSSHTFAAWTVLSAILRYKCSMDLSNPV
ncbi:Ergosterol biosynthetic protein 28 [Smittium culicis]|uniref:Ergosterol biosynthetic protein 28 n=1 Tax=Smittium culicis TaxID=133412 RepID=A0A1R1X514_9FUNG|nr:Ergosterol biosynthetic protein 28 [Smittium culicis]